MLVHDNGKVNILAENRCANSSMYRHFDLPLYGMMYHNNREQLRNKWKTNPSEKIVVLRHPYQRIHSAIAYHELRGVPTYTSFQLMSEEERKKHQFFWKYKDRLSKPYEDFKHADIVSHCIPYFRHLIGVNFRYINFDRIAEYLDVHAGPKTNTTSKDFSVDFLDYVELDDIKFEKFLYEEYLHRFEEISPEEWKEKTITA